MSLFTAAKLAIFYELTAYPAPFYVIIDTLRPRAKDILFPTCLFIHGYANKSF